MNFGGSVRAFGLAKFIGWSCAASLGWFLIYWAGIHWHTIPIGGSIPIVGAPGALALVGLAEMITGMTAKTMGSKLNQLQLAPWQQNLIWLLVFFIGIGLLMTAMVAFS